jgi:hypothetical protein
VTAANVPYRSKNCRNFERYGTFGTRRDGLRNGSLHLVEEVDVVGQALRHRPLGAEQRLVSEIALHLGDREVVVEVKPFHRKGFQ